MDFDEDDMNDDDPVVPPWAVPPKIQVFDETDPTWPMVVVQWRDAHEGGDGTWTNTDGYVPEVVLPITVGWVWPKCKPGYLTLVGTVMNDAEEPEVVSNVNHIPWEMIVNVYSLGIHMPVDWNQELD